MNARCSVCGSYALNIAPSSGLCDVHFYKVQRDELLEAARKALIALRQVSHLTTEQLIADTALEIAIAKATGVAA